MQIKRPQPTYPSLEKFTRHVENAMKERVATLRKTGRYDNENILDRVQNNWARVVKLASRGEKFEVERAQVIEYIADRYGDLQKQSNNPVAQGIGGTDYIEDEPELKARLGMWDGDIDEEREDDDDSDRNRFELGKLLELGLGKKICD